MTDQFTTIEQAQDLSEAHDIPLLKKLVASYITVLAERDQLRAQLAEASELLRRALNNEPFVNAAKEMLYPKREAIDAAEQRKAGE